MANKTSSRSRAKRQQDELETAYHKKSRKKAKKSNRAAAVVAISFAVIAIVLCVAAGYIYFMNAELDGVILENVTVAGVDVGGMTQADAINAVRNATADTYSKTPMVVKVLESQAEIPVSHVGSLDVAGAVKAAYKFGNSGSQSKRQEQQQIAMQSGYTVDITPYLKLDETAIRDILNELGANYSSTLSQSSYEVTGSAPNQTLVVNLGVPEYGLDLNKLYDQVLDAYSRNVFFVEGVCGMIEPDPIDLESINSKYYIAPTDASFDTKTFEVIEGVDGYGLDIEAAQKALTEAAYGTTVEIPFSAIKPEVTAEKLSAKLFRDQLATYTAKHNSDSDRDTNLRLACEAINGMVLYPGDVFSYNDALGERTAARGYKLGPSYAGNQTVMTYGGGICQVSSALYHCTLVAELETLVRENHSFAPAYMPLGMDAAVSWGSMDFRFRNSSDYPVRIEASATGGSVTVTLMGTNEKDYYIELEYETISEEDYSVSYKTMAADNSEGYKDGDYITEPYKGYQVKTYRCKYNSETKELISRDFIDQSVYKKRDGVICRIEGNSSGIGGGVISDNDGALPPE
ncbi:MAG: VanW family protein [Oscillospiraceae bacterium]|nr:VanW family protein [Oscillospiraceae bacterium]